MDYRIEPALPDGICVRVEFWVETWDDLATLMKRIDAIEDRPDSDEEMAVVARFAH